jgi:uncharacterized damage-inducible protein DinB
MLDYVRRLFVYDDWANREILAGIAALPTSLPRSVRWLAHVLSAEKLWWERITLQPQSLPVWPDFTLAECTVLSEEMAEVWKDYFACAAEADLALSIGYKNSKGESWESRIDDILIHVAMHGTYHRGQIAADFRAAGHTPPYTDFIHAVRQSFVK